MNADDELKQLDELLALPEGDPRRAELLRDPALRALHDSYVAFQRSDAAGVPGLDRAEDALSAWRGREIAGAPGAALSERATPRAAVRDESPSWWSRLFAPSLRPALAFAALAVVAGAVWWTMRPTTPANVEVLRGGRDGEMTLHAATVGERGVSLSWSPVPEADSYEVEFYTERLEKLATLSETADTAAIVPPNMRTLMARGGIEVLYRVVARREGEELSHSAVEPLPR